LQTEGRLQLARQLLQLVRDRYPNTPAAAEAARILAELERDRSDDSGRTELMVFGTTYGAALGVALPVALQAESSEAIGFGLLLGAPAGFFASRVYGRSRSLSEGQASAIISGATWGAWQAFGWREVLNIGDQEICTDFPDTPGPDCFQEGAPAHAVMKAGIAGSLVGLGVGALLSRKNISRGTAATVNFGALWGTWFGVALGILSNQDDSEDGLLSAALVGGNVGLLTGAVGNRSWQLTEPRARLISISGVGGLLAGFGLLFITQPDNDNTAVLIPLTTSIAGLALGARWTRHMEREAMIDMKRHRLGFQLPSVQPIMIDAARKRVPALGINLIQARF
jgi:hypothetical protein